MDTKVIWLLIIGGIIITTVSLLVRYIIKTYVSGDKRDENGRNPDRPGSKDAGSNLIKSVDKDKLN